MEGREEMDKSYLNKFYKKSLPEKKKALLEAGAISNDDFSKLENNMFALESEVAEQMIENYITNYELPFGVALNFVIDGKDVLIPMVTEEPSVIAAASNAGKIVSQSRSAGFTTKMSKRHMISQITFTDVPNTDAAKQAILDNEEAIIDLANAAHPTILGYGGGAKRVETRIIPQDDTYETPEFFIVHLVVDTAEAMGANIVNTMAEAIAPYLSDLTNGANLINILSNYATESLVTARCSIDPQFLATKTMTGEEVRDRIILATKLALADPYRAVTHNKGIMNGIDSVLVATGNDWRAVEAGAHAFASKSGKYRSLSRWFKDDQGFLAGELTLPISVGSVGGTLSVHPTAQFANRLLGQPNAIRLSEILASVGLAQNLSAVRALVTEGIQKGHMALQARSLAIRVGATGEEIEQVALQLQEAEFLNSETARRILEDLRAH
jgi:hydroxymethylglutaryl-CoA reductase